MKHQVLGTSKSPEAGNSPFCSGNSKRSAVVWEGKRGGRRTLEKWPGAQRSGYGVEGSRAALMPS